MGGCTLRLLSIWMPYYPFNIFAKDERRKGDKLSKEEEFEQKIRKAFEEYIESTSLKNLNKLKYVEEAVKNRAELSIFSGMSFDKIQKAAEELYKKADYIPPSHNNREKHRVRFEIKITRLIANLAARLKEQAEANKCDEKTDCPIMKKHFNHHHWFDKEVEKNQCRVCGDPIANPFDRVLPEGIDKKKPISPNCIDLIVAHSKKVRGDQ